MSARLRLDSNRRLLSARDTIDRHYGDALDIATLARSVYLSRAHFIRSFRATFGETPHRYLQRRRIERAMALLRESDETVTDISLAVGFASLGTFSRTFRETTRDRTQLARTAQHFRISRPGAGRLG